MSMRRDRLCLHSRRERFSRRKVLKGLLSGGGLATLALPVLPSLLWSRSARAQETNFPIRFGLWFWGNGNRPERWTPAETGTEFELSPELAPLVNHQDKLAIISGYSVKVPNLSPHWSGMVGLLTGEDLVGDDDDWTVAVPTIDQLLAAEIGGDTVYRSIELSVGSEDSVSYAGAYIHNPGENNPFSVYERLFGDTFRAPGEGGTVDPALGYRRSVLDAVMGDIAALQSVLGTQDRARLEQHLDGVRELEARLARLQEDPPNYEACERPDAPAASFPEVGGRPPLDEIHAAQAQLAAMALACDQTRVLSMCFSRPLNNILFPDADDGSHNLTHHETGDQPQVDAIATYSMAQFAVFLDALAAMPEGDETLLDHCAILAASEVSEGKTHSLDEIPLVLAGSAGGAFRTGQHIRSFTQDNVNQALLSVVRGLDVPLAGLGNGDTYTDQGLSELEA